MTSSVTGYDHVAITTSDVARSTAFYCDVLGAVVLQDHPAEGALLVRSIRIGGAAMNIHRQGNGLWLVAKAPTPGSADLCFRWDGPIENAVTHLGRKGVPIIDGPSARFTASGAPSLSVYFLDPDGNLLELMAETATAHDAGDVAATLNAARGPSA